MDAAGNGRAVDAALGLVITRFPFQQVVIVQFEAGDAAAVDVAHADDLSAHLPIGINALVVGNEVDARQVEGLHLLGDVDVGFALHESERGVGGFELGLVIGRLAADDAGEFGSRLGSILHLRGIGVDGRCINACREHGSVAIVDGSATRLNLESDGSRLLGLSRIARRHDDLQIEKTQEEQDRDDPEHDEGDESAVRFDEFDVGKRGAERRPSRYGDAAAAGRAAGGRRRPRRSASGLALARPMTFIGHGALFLGSGCVRHALRERKIARRIGSHDVGFERDRLNGCRSRHVEAVARFGFDARRI